MKEKVFFSKIQEARETYMIEYFPCYEGNHAILSLTFLENTAKVQIIEFMKKEFFDWITKYPVPIMVTAFDDAGDMICVKDDNKSHLFGWIDTVTKQVKYSWNIKDMPKYDVDDFMDGWDKIFQEISFKTGEQVKQQAYKEGKQRGREIKAFKVVLLIWFCVIPATWIIIQQFGPKYIGWIVTFYSIIKIILKAKKMYSSKAKGATSPKDEKELKMGHYYYHCERNPDGFAKLRAENIIKEEKQRTREEFDKLRNRQCSTNS